MNRRHFLKGTGTALLGVLSVGLLGKAIKKPYVEHTSFWEMTDAAALLVDGMPEHKDKGTGRFWGHVKLSDSPTSIQFRRQSAEEIYAIQKQYVEEFGWADGSKKWYAPKTS